MAFLFFGSSKPSALKQFVLELTSDLAKRYPPELDNKVDKKISPTRLTRIMEDTCGKVAAYKTENRLSWLGKSRLANHFKWALIDMGYSKTFVEFATEAIVVHLTQPDKKY